MENEKTSFYMKETDDNLLPTYSRAPIVLEKGEGCYLYDTEGKKYLDFEAGIAVCSLGYGDPEFTQTLKAQTDRLLHTSNLFYNTTCGQAAEALKKACGMDRVFFTNSGTESMEGAMKAAREYASKKGSGRSGFVAMEGSFHGRSMGALSVTSHEAYRTPFEPLIPGVKFAKFNDIESVKALADESVCAVILEPIQGEGGINVADPDFLKEVRKLCDERGILLIFDEIQCGMGRTGEMFAWQYYGVKPDIMAMAKAIGNGVPAGAFAMTDDVAEGSLALGDHGTTFGGNPLACAAVSATLSIFKERDIPGHVREISDYLTPKLDALVEKYDCILCRKGLGLIQGLKLKIPAAKVIDAARGEGLLMISAQSDTLRIVPPLIIEKAQADEFISKLTKAFDAVANGV